MNKNTFLNTCALSISCLIFSHSAFAKNSFSEVRAGFEYVKYHEKLSDVAGLGELSQAISVVNPAVRQISYSPVNEQWGLYIDSAATIASDIDTETWSVDSFGAVQQNAFKIKANEIGFKAAYHLSPALQVVSGVKLYTLSFTRSNFKFVQPGAKAFDDALKALPRDPGDPVPRFVLPGQFYDDAVTGQENNPGYLSPVVTVSEDQMGVLLVAGMRFDTWFDSSAAKVSWYAEAEVSTPMYSQIQNTQFETTTLSESFNGFGLYTRLGARYHLTENISLVTGVDAYYKKRDAVVGNLGERRLSVPDIDYVNVSYSLGLFWSY